MVDGTYSRWSRANRAPNTLLRNTLLRNMLLRNMLLRWYRQLFLAAGRNRRSTAVPARGSQPASVTATLEETTVPLDHSRGFGSTEPVEPAAMLSEEPLDGHGEEDVVNAWRAEQLQLLGLSPTLAEAFAGLVDWHQIANLVERGCAPQLALEIVR